MVDRSFVIRPNRRTFLRAGTVAGVTGLAGCSWLSGTNKAESDDWLMYQFDAANTGHTGATGPAEDVTERWSVQKDDTFRSWSRPIVADGTIFISGSHTVYALDADTGEELWRYEGTSGASFRAPAIADKTVVLAGESDVWGLDAASGEQTWHLQLIEDGLRSGISPPRVAEGRVYVGTTNGLVVVDVGSGDERWRHTVPYPGRTYPGPAISDGTVYVGDPIPTRESDGTPRGLFALDAEMGETQWHREFSAGLKVAPAVTDEFVYVNGGALDPNTGEWLSWGTETSPWFAPAIADGNLFVPSRNTLDAFDTENGERLWGLTNAELPQPRSPAVADDTLSVTSRSGHLFGLAPEEGTERWRVNISDGEMRPPGTAPTVVNGRVYVAWFHGRIFAFEQP